MPDLRPLFTERTAAKTRPGRLMTGVAAPPRLVLDTDALGLLRDGLGWFDMEIRWLAFLDSSNVLRLWRSWTGYQTYEVTVDVRDPDRAVLRGLKIEQHPDVYTGDLTAEPDRFERILVSIINTLRAFRAGHTPHGPTPDADELPPPWPQSP